MEVVVVASRLRGTAVEAPLLQRRPPVRLQLLRQATRPISRCSRARSVRETALPLPICALAQPQAPFGPDQEQQAASRFEASLAAFWSVRSAEREPNRSSQSVFGACTKPQIGGQRRPEGSAEPRAAPAEPRAAPFEPRGALSEANLEPRPRADPLHEPCPCRSRAHHLPRNCEKKKGTSKELKAPESRNTNRGE